MLLSFSISQLCQRLLYFSLVSFNFFFNTGVQIQSFTHAKQEVNHPATPQRNSWIKGASRQVWACLTWKPRSSLSEDFEESGKCEFCSQICIKGQSSLCTFWQRWWKEFRNAILSEWIKNIAWNLKNTRASNTISVNPHKICVLLSQGC